MKNADLNPNKLFGIIAPNNVVRDRYYQALSISKMIFDNGKPRIETYNNSNNQNLSFNEGGIMVINASSCKGLEFDTVFLADINFHFFNARNSDQTKRLFYVMVARAKERVIMLKEATMHCPVETILPVDNEIMERK